METFRIGVDVGGTFTDFLLIDSSGTWEVYKVLSTPRDPSIGLLNGLKEMAGHHDLRLEEFLGRVELIVHGTTVATNAVLTRNGARTGLLTTKGMRDVLQMRRGIREEFYNNRFVAPKPLVPRNFRIGIDERVSSEGETVRPVSYGDLEKAIGQFRSEGIEAVAVCFMHSYANPQNEKAAAEEVERSLEGVHVTVSSELLPRAGMYDRLSTTVLNSYVGPVLTRYLRRLTQSLKEAGFEGVLRIMQSNGGITSPKIAAEMAATSLLSGPAAGPVAGLYYAGAQRLTNFISVDMGGTSFDVALVRDGVPFVADLGDIGGLRIALPMLEILTIGAGGGSIAWIDSGGLLRVGPMSAGADPGPVCYDHGGEIPACTDANLILGYLSKDFFAGGRLPLNFEKSEKALQDLGAKLGLSAVDAAAGIYNVINVSMANAVKEISVERGLDPRDFPLIVAGGCGPIHACMIALELEIPTVIVPRYSSIFCASGMLMSDLKHDFVRSCLFPLGDLASAEAVLPMYEAMLDEGRQLLEQEGIGEPQREVKFFADMRYVGQHSSVTIDLDSMSEIVHEPSKVRDRFNQRHQELYGYCLEFDQSQAEVTGLRLQALGKVSKPDFGHLDLPERNIIKGKRRAYIPSRKQFEMIDVLDGDVMPCGYETHGPVMIEQVNTTVFVPPEFSVVCDSFGSFVLSTGAGNRHSLARENAGKPSKS